MTVVPAGRRTTTPNGRGLFLVTALSDVCGMTIDEQSEGTGKAVWFELNVPPGRTA
ncbi:hypothetical protein [Streptomyces sp. NPDC005336]|uniref:hypothetical protein n=1 Tax=unclassified Streptomyces TaxID=2593676 RepID=UPI0033B7DFE7